MEHRHWDRRQHRPYCHRAQRQQLPLPLLLTPLALLPKQPRLQVSLRRHLRLLRIRKRRMGTRWCLLLSWGSSLCMVMDTHMDTDIRRGAMSSISYSRHNNKHSSNGNSSKMRGRITIMRYRMIHLDSQWKLYAIGSVSVSAVGPPVRRTLSVGYSQCMVQGRRVARALVRVAVRVAIRARAMTG